MRCLRIPWLQLWGRSRIVADGFRFRSVDRANADLGDAGIALKLQGALAPVEIDGAGRLHIRDKHVICAGSMNR